MNRSLIAAAIVAAAAPLAAAAPQKGYIDNRLSLISFWHPVTGQSETQSVFAGAAYAYSPLPEFLWIVLAAGYVAVGERPGDGRNVIAVLGGLEGAFPIMQGFAVFARALGGADIPLRSSTTWVVEPVVFSGHLGVRFGFAEVFAAGGLGPANGLNMGFGVALNAGF
jgi:hypothetical protein